VRKNCGRLQKWLCSSVVAVSLLVIWVSGAQATPLNLTTTLPDIASGFITVSYDASTHAFSATGFSLTLNNTNLDTFGNYSITATILNNGTATGGSLFVGGTIGAATDPLLTGSLTALGFRNTGGDPLEFLFSVTGGSLASSFGSVAGVILSGSSFPSTLFTASWFNDDSGVSDTFGVSEVPEPSIMLLLLSGIVGFGVRNMRFRPSI